MFLKHLTEFYGESAKKSDSYARIVNDRHFQYNFLFRLTFLTQKYNEIFF